MWRNAVKWEWTLRLPSTIIWSMTYFHRSTFTHIIIFFFIPRETAWRKKLLQGRIEDNVVIAKQYDVLYLLHYFENEG